MPPRAIAAQMAKALNRCLDVINPAMDRAKFTQLNRNAGSLDSLRSGIRIWHVFATTVLDYKINLSAPPRDSDHVLCWLACFAQYATAMNYLQYLKNFCEVEGLSTAWYDNSILAWKKGSQAQGSKWLQVHGQEDALHLGIDKVTDQSLRSEEKSKDLHLTSRLLGIPTSASLRGFPTAGWRRA